MTTKIHKPYLKVLEDAGYRVLSVHQHGHIALRCTSPRGKPCTFTIGASPSDHRALLNFRTVVRRRRREEEEANPCASAAS